jgi:hypothetical protein
MEPWWTPVQAGWIGAMVGVLGAALGSTLGILGGVCAQHGRAKGATYAVVGVGLGIGLVGIVISLVALASGQPYHVWYPPLLVISLVALASGQPYHVWYPPLLMGAVLVPVMGGCLPVIRMRYRQAESRKLQAQEFLRS